MVLDDKRGGSFSEQPGRYPARLWNLAWDQVLALDGAVWKSVVIALVAICGLWLFNIAGLRAWNVAFTVLGYVGIWWIGLKPAHVALSGAAGGLFAAFFDRDLSQGLGRGPAVLYQVVRQIAYIYLLIGFASFTWDFSGNPVAFWLVLIGIIILIETGDVLGKWKNRIIAGYVAISIGAALLSTLGVYSGRAFDPNTGEALYMVDPTTGRIDSEGRKPGDCAAKPCFSPETGEKLVPMQREQALERNPASAVSSFIGNIQAAIFDVFAASSFDPCEITTGIVKETPTAFTFRRDCVTYLDTALLKHGEDELWFDLEKIDKKFASRKPDDFVKESGWVMKDGRWMFKLVPNPDAFGREKSVQMVTYSSKLQ